MWAFNMQNVISHSGIPFRWKVVNLFLLLYKCVKQRFYFYYPRFDYSRSWDNMRIIMLVKLCLSGKKKNKKQQTKGKDSHLTVHPFPHKPNTFLSWEYKICLSNFATLVTLAMTSKNCILYNCHSEYFVALALVIL